MLLMIYTFPVIRELPKQPENVTTKQVPYGIALRWDRPRDPDVPVHGYIVGYGRFIPEVYREVLSAGKTQYTIHKLRKNVWIFHNLIKIKLPRSAPYTLLM